MTDRTERLSAVRHRCDSRGRHFFSIPQGYWGPVAQTMQIPFLAEAACSYLRQGAPRAFAVRAKAMAHAQDCAARLLSLALGYRPDASEGTAALCERPEQFLAAALRHLREFPDEPYAVVHRDVQVHLCRTLPSADESCALLVPSVPEDTGLPVLIQQRDRLPINECDVRALTGRGAPVILIQADDAPVPEGWPVFEPGEADTAWFGCLLFFLYEALSPRSLAMPEAAAVAREILEQFGPGLAEEDFQLAAEFVCRFEGRGNYVTAERFWGLVRKMPHSVLSARSGALNTMFFRDDGILKTYDLAFPALLAACWRHTARQAPRAWPHADAPVPAGISDTRRIVNRMLYEPGESLGLREARPAVLVADCRGDCYGLRTAGLVTYAELFELAKSVPERGKDFEYWVLVLDEDPRALNPADLRSASFAFHVTPDEITLFDGAQGLREFAEGAHAYQREAVRRRA